MTSYCHDIEFDDRIRIIPSGARFGFVQHRYLDTALDLFVGQFQLKRELFFDVHAGQAGQTRTAAGAVAGAGTGAGHIRGAGLRAVRRDHSRFQDIRSFTCKRKADYAGLQSNDEGAKAMMRVPHTL